MSGEIITNGVNNFTPIIDKLGTIAGEIIPYMTYIAIACLGITLAYKALSYITGYVKNKTRSIFYYRDVDYKNLGRDKNGYNTLQKTISRKRKRKPNRSKIRK